MDISRWISILFFGARCTVAPFYFPIPFAESCTCKKPSMLSQIRLAVKLHFSFVVMLRRMQSSLVKWHRRRPFYASSIMMRSKSEKWSMSFGFHVRRCRHRTQRSSFSSRWHIVPRAWPFARPLQRREAFAPQRTQRWPSTSDGRWIFYHQGTKLVVKQFR